MKPIFRITAANDIATLAPWREKSLATAVDSHNDD
jgi:hypothetical protein